MFKIFRRKIDYVELDEVNKLLEAKHILRWRESVLLESIKNLSRRK